MSNKIRKIPDSFKTYEDGKGRRYGLLFSVNGGAFAVAKLFPTDNICAVIGGLTLFELSVGMILFTVLMSVDIVQVLFRRLPSDCLPDQLSPLL